VQLIKTASRALAARHPLPARLVAALAVGAVLATAPPPAFAQESSQESRLRKIEAEIRALQRNVFPGGEGRFFEPQISAGEQANGQKADRPSTTAITDILVRLDAIELQLQRLTALTEENANALSRLDERITALETAPGAARTGSPDSNLAAMTGGASAESASSESGMAAQDAGEGSAAEPVSSGSDSASESAEGPSPERLAAVQAIAKPDTGDAGEDEYTYGFRLWDAKLYPEARQQLSNFVEDYPDHPLITYGRNLLGRAFLDDGLAEEAARWFLRNYQADRTARRAPDSLLFLAESMIAMGDTRRACIALAEFGDTYPAIASGRLADQYERNRSKVTCE
jgi:TolA-binding protein